VKTWLIFFGLWVVGCIGAYVWLKPLEVSHEAPFTPIKVEQEAETLILPVDTEMMEAMEKIEMEEGGSRSESEDFEEIP
jgi:hypothetical protein